MTFSINDVITEDNYYRNEVKKIRIKIKNRNFILKDYIHLNNIITKLKHPENLSIDLQKMYIKSLNKYIPLLDLLDLPIENIEKFYNYELDYDFKIINAPHHFSEEFILDVMEILNKLENSYKETYNRTILSISFIDFYMCHYIGYLKFESFNKKLYQKIVNNYDNYYKIIGKKTIEKYLGFLEKNVYQDTK
jgi:hypothetical protein